MRIYLAGPMTGLPDYNRPAFNSVAAQWRALGLDVVNPIETDRDDGSGPWAAYLRRDIAQLVTCDAIAVLPEWGESRGTRLEVTIAHALGMLVFDAITGERYPDRQLHALGIPGFPSTVEDR